MYKVPGIAPGTHLGGPRCPCLQAVTPGSLPGGLSVVEKLIESLESTVPEKKQLENTAVMKLKGPSQNPSFASPT